MRKHLTAYVVLLVPSLALATPSYWAAVETTGYDNAAASGAAEVGSYALYYCKAGGTSLGGATSVSGIETYLAEADNLATIRSSATMFDQVSYSDGEYHILDYVCEEFTLSDYVAVAFYGSEAYRVYGLNSGTLTPNGQLVFNEAYADSGTVGGWLTSVPEPASSLMLLLGVAGLVLRRKRT